MKNLEEVLNLCEMYLLDLLNYNCIKDMKDYLNNKYIIGYDIFIKQAIFEIYYNYYINNVNGNHSISDIYKRWILKDDNAKSYEYANDKDYVKLRRVYNDFRVYNDKLAIEHNKPNDVQHLEFKNANEKMKGHKIRKYQENQLLDINEFDIFTYIKDGSIVDSKKIDSFRLISALKEIDKVYGRINDNYNNYFERSIQYFQLEQNCRIETNYLLASAMKKVKISLQEKKDDINRFKCFFAVKRGSNLLQNKFIIGIDKFINAYLKNPEIATLIYSEIYELNLLKYKIRTLVIEQLSMYGDRVNYMDNDSFFKDYLGEGQHITKNKKWEALKLKDFRDLYSPE